MSKYFAALGLITCIAGNAAAATLRTMNVGLGTGSVTSSPAGISCGTTCNATFGSVLVTLTAAPAAGSAFVRWGGDCSGTAATCTINLSTARSVRAEFRLNPDITPMTVADLPPANLQAYLTAHPEVNTPARFLKALPADFKQNWILMSRSESLQTGTAETPRILMPSADGRFVFTFGLQVHSAYPGAHPNAVEYMQWDPAEKNFRFHEIVLDTIPALSNTVPVGSGRTPRVVVPLRNRGVSVDDARCFQCHSTRNVLNRTGPPGTTGVPVGLVKAKSKPNWDAYDSWGGMMPFNRDRIYKGSLEAASFRKIFNLWTWSTRPGIRAVIEQLELQPSTVTVPATDVITRQEGGPDDGHILFAFDGGSIGTTEPSPAGTATASINYSFDGLPGTSGTTVQRGGDYVMLHHSSPPVADQEGRGVDLFDRLGGLDDDLNAQRIADELNDHRFATGSFGIDVRPVAVAISKGCLTLANVSTKITFDSTFFDARHGGLTLAQLRNDTDARSKIFPRRKADIQKINLDRTGDPYVVLPENGLIQQYGAGTSASTSTAISRLRQEVFRRPIESGFGNADQTGVMGGLYVDRESYNPNTEKLALFRYFLEPLGVSVDKWSMGVRGRSRSYTFADVFGDYLSRITADLEADLAARPFPGLTTPVNCSDPAFFAAVTASLASLPAPGDVPTFTDVQRIFNKGCIECHGGLGYPPFDVIFDADYLDFSEDETSATSRLGRSHTMATAFTTNNPATSYLFQRITQGGEKCPDSTASTAPLMPCGGPALSQVDVDTIRRWIIGGRPATVGDPHIRTVDGTNYDFQSDGEFVLLRGENLEIQSRQTAVPTAAPLGPDGHSGLTTCVSINTAAAFRVGPHRISYQPGLRGEPNPEGLELRVDGRLTRMSDSGIALSSGGRIVATTAADGIQIPHPARPVAYIRGAAGDAVCVQLAIQLARQRRGGGDERELSHADGAARAATGRARADDRRRRGRRLRAARRRDGETVSRRRRAQRRALVVSADGIPLLLGPHFERHRPRALQHRPRSRHVAVERRARPRLDSRRSEVPLRPRLVLADRGGRARRLAHELVAERVFGTAGQSAVARPDHGRPRQHRRHRGAAAGRVERAALSAGQRVSAHLPRRRAIRRDAAHRGRDDRTGAGRVRTRRRAAARGHELLRRRAGDALRRRSAAALRRQRRRAGAGVRPRGGTAAHRRVSRRSQHPLPSRALAGTRAAGVPHPGRRRRRRDRAARIAARQHRRETEVDGCVDALSRRRAPAVARPGPRKGAAGRGGRKRRRYGWFAVAHRGAAATVIDARSTSRAPHETRC
jgi:hypothetical protein